MTLGWPGLKDLAAKIIRGTHCIWMKKALGMKKRECRRRIIIVEREKSKAATTRRGRREIKTLKDGKRSDAETDSRKIKIL